MVKQFAPSRIDADDVWELLPRISVQHQPAFDQGSNGVGRVRLVVSFTDGESIEIQRSGSRANESPQNNDEVAAKYRALTDGLITPTRQAAIESMVMRLDELADIRELTTLLAPPVAAAFE